MGRAHSVVLAVERQGTAQDCIVPELVLQSGESDILRGQKQSHGYGLSNALFLTATDPHTRSTAMPHTQKQRTNQPEGFLRRLKKKKDHFLSKKPLNVPWNSKQHCLVLLNHLLIA